MGHHKLAVRRRMAAEPLTFLDPVSPRTLSSPWADSIRYRRSARRNRQRPDALERRSEQAPAWIDTEAVYGRAAVEIAQAGYFTSRTTKSGEGAAKPAVTAYSALPNAAIVVGTFVDGFDVNGSVMKRTIAPDR
jgi:hypothetical protein